MNKYHTLGERRRVAKQKLTEITQLLEGGYTAGKAPVADIGLDPLRATLLDAHHSAKAAAPQPLRPSSQGRGGGEEDAQGRDRAGRAEWGGVVGGGLWGGIVGAR